jgi:hypothetical protein
MYPIFKQVFEIGGIYVAWIFIHYVASYLYIYFCVPPSFMGFIMSPFLVATPQCVGLRWAVTTGANTIHAMWGVVGVWICGKLLTKQTTI